jgi:hypothetical protein
MQVWVRLSHDPQRGRESVPTRFNAGAKIAERRIRGDNDHTPRELEIALLVADGCPRKKSPLGSISPLEP